MMQSYNILLVVPTLERGGVERYCIDLAVGLKENGWNPIVVSAGGILVKELLRADIKHIQLPVHSKNLFSINKNAKTLAKIIKSENIDIVHANSRAPAWACYKACKLTGTKFMTTFHAAYGLGYFGLKRKYNKVMVKGDIIIAPSYFIANHIVENYKVDPKKIVVIHNWFNDIAFSPKSVSVERMIKLANMMHIPEDKRVISMVGRLSPIKGGINFVEAIAKLPNENVVAFIVGRGSAKFKKELINKIKELNLNNIVNIVEDYDIPTMYALSDVVVNASIVPESFGLTILEASAMGRPVVATNHGGATEIILDGITGKLVEPCNSDALKDGIQWALSLNEEERKNLSIQAIKHANFNFSRVSKINQTIDVYLSLMNK